MAVTALSSLETRACTYDVIRGPTLSSIGLYAWDSGDLHRGVDGRCEMQRFIPVERERKIKNATKQQPVNVHLGFMGRTVYLVSELQRLCDDAHSGLTKVLRERGIVASPALPVF